MSQERVQIKVNDVKDMLNNGKTREQIAEHYGITMAAAKKTIFSHEKIKGLKTKKTYDFVDIVDDDEVTEPLDTAQNGSTDSEKTEPQEESESLEVNSPYGYKSDDDVEPEKAGEWED